MPPSVDASALSQLTADSATSRSDALLVSQHGKTLVNVVGHPGEPIDTMSITKAVLCLGVGVAVDRGLLHLETTIGELFSLPETDPHGAIQISNLLGHSGGLQEPRSMALVRKRGNIVADALSAPFDFPTGSRFDYSNRGANLLSGALARATGMRADQFIERAIFSPLGIRHYRWRKDRHDVAYGMGGLHLTGEDLLSLGTFVLAGGTHEGAQLVSREWLRRSTRELAPVQPAHRRAGLLWWLLPSWMEVSIDERVVAAWRAAGIPETFIERTAPLQGKVFASYRALEAELIAAFADPKLSVWSETTWKRDIADVTFRFGPIIGTYAVGSYGQYLVVVPEAGLVAVRLKAIRNTEDVKDETRHFLDFPERIVALLRPATSEGTADPGQ